jgi:hypothetical protein
MLAPAQLYRRDHKPKSYGALDAHVHADIKQTVCHNRGKHNGTINLIPDFKPENIDEISATGRITPCILTPPLLASFPGGPTALSDGLTRSIVTI